MRIAALAVVGLLTAAPLVHGQEGTGWAAKLFRTDDGKVPAGHDFGTVPRGALLRHRFSITNIYAVPLTVATSVSCGCVTPTVTPQVLQPRETGILDLTMDTTKFNGPKKVELFVTVYSPNQQFMSSTAFVITANCRMDVTLNPAQAEFGVVPRGQQMVKELRVSYAGPLAWQITGATGNDSAPFDVRFEPEPRRGRQVDYKVSLILKPDAPAGTHRGDLTLQTNDPNNPQVPVPYDVTVLAPLTALPEVSPFGSVKAGDTAAPRRVIIRSSGKPFHITEVVGQADGLTAEYDKDAMGATHILTLKLQPTAAGAFQRSLTIKTDLDGGTVTVKVVATVQ